MSFIDEAVSVVHRVRLSGADWRRLALLLFGLFGLYVWASFAIVRWGVMEDRRNFLDRLASDEARLKSVESNMSDLQLVKRDVEWIRRSLSQSRATITPPEDQPRLPRRNS